jgi:hypothetical protein
VQVPSDKYSTQSSSTLAQLVTKYLDQTAIRVVEVRQQRKKQKQNKAIVLVNDF